MLRSNGNPVKSRNNYHMSLGELIILLKFLKNKYNPQWFLVVMIQFCLGLRASEVLNIQIHDFKHNFLYLNYRQAKTNNIIYNEPVPKPLSKIIISYIYFNTHRLIDGYLFPNHNGKGKTYTTETYGAFWSKWRKGIGGRFLDHYKFNNQIRYRISSHSLRRLHRTILLKNIENPYIVKELCNYSDYKSFERYINQQEIHEQKEELLRPITEPLTKKLTMMSKGQQQLNTFY